ncbi:MAG: hypothetical protein V1492_02120 [Candidatus Micrarchaeota archaeon]
MKQTKEKNPAVAAVRKINVIGGDGRIDIRELEKFKERFPDAGKMPFVLIARQCAEKGQHAEAAVVCEVVAAAKKEAEGYAAVGECEKAAEVYAQLGMKQQAVTAYFTRVEGEFNKLNDNGRWDEEKFVQALLKAATLYHVLVAKKKDGAEFGGRLIARELTEILGVIPEGNLRIAAEKLGLAYQHIAKNLKVRPLARPTEDGMERFRQFHGGHWHEEHGRRCKEEERENERQYLDIYKRIMTTAGDYFLKVGLEQDALAVYQKVNAYQKVNDALQQIPPEAYERIGMLTKAAKTYEVRGMPGDFNKAEDIYAALGLNDELVRLAEYYIGQEKYADASRIYAKVAGM